MFTEIGLIPVYNKLYKLELDEKEIEKIITKSEKIRPTQFIYSFIANETLIRLHGGKNNSTYEIELIPYDKKTKTVNSSKSFLDTIIENAPCYTIEAYKNDSQTFLFRDTDIDVLSLPTLDKDMLAVAIKLLNYETVTIVKQLDIVKKLIRDSYLNTFTAIETIYGQTNEDVNSVVSWAFNIKRPKQTKVTTLSNTLKSIFQILTVSENNNIRIATAKNSDNSTWYRNYSNNVIIVVDENQVCYDYIDVGRRFYMDPSKIESSTLHSQAKIFPKLFLLDKDVKIPQQKEIFEDILMRKAEQKAFLVDSLEIESVVRRFQRKEQQKVQKEVKKKKLREKFSKRIKALDDEKGKFSINGIKMTKHSIEYANQQLECKDIKIKTLLNNYRYYYNLDDLNFDDLTGAFFLKIKNRIEHSFNTKTLSGKIGEVEFNVTNKISQTKTGSVSRNVYINNYRINKGEIEEILNRGLCFENQKDFDGFVHQVSKCSLRIHYYLDEGIQLNVRDDYKNKKIKFKIPLVRDKNINYIVLGDKKYRVSNTNKLIKLEGTWYMYEVINTILNPSVVQIDGPDDIAYIISKGEELHKKDKEKNRKLIEKVEKLFKLELQNLTINGLCHRGYVIKGKLGSYFLDVGKTDKETIFDRLRVYSLPHWQYVCMIDKAVQQTGPSNLINRIFALHNDSLISRDIQTLNQTN